MKAIKVLLVDDELLIDDEVGLDATTGVLAGYMSYYHLELVEAGYNVVVANDPDEALRKLSMEDVDCAVLDLMMPPGRSFKNINTSEGLHTGWKLAERIRRDFPDVKIVVLSNNTDTSALNEDGSREWSMLEYGVVQLVLSKLETLPSRLVQEIENVVK